VHQVVEALNELEVFIEEPQFAKTDCNHLYLHFVPTVQVDLEPLLYQLKVRVHWCGGFWFFS
jgi:hypothetical protein